MASPALFDSSLLRRGLFDEDFPSNSVFDPWFGVEDPPIVITDRVLFATDRSGAHFGATSRAGSRYSVRDRSGRRYRAN